MLNRLSRFALTAAVLIAGPNFASAQAINSEALSDPRVRQAIAYAIDMDTIVETLLEGKAIAADSMLPNGPHKPSGLNPYSYNPEKARELLAAAKWDSSRELDMVFYYGDQLTVDLMAALQAYLSDVGVKMTYRKLEGDVGAQLTTRPTNPVDGVSNIDWDLGYGAAAATALQEYYNPYKTGGTSHTPSDPNLDRMIDAINASADPNEQRPAYFELQEYWNSKLDALPLYYQQLFIYESKKLNRNGHGYGNEQYNYDTGIVDWTMEPDANGKQVMYTNTAPPQFFELPWANLGIWITSKVVFDKLLSADGSLSVNGGQLAESYSVAADGLSASFTLQDGLTWHDGSALTVDDVAWSIKTALRVPNIHAVVANTFTSIKGGQAYRDGDADDVSGISTDGNTITLTMSKLDPNMLLTFTQFAILPQAHLGDEDPLQLQQSSFWQYPIGSGPFRIEEVKMNDFVRYVPFENYHGGVAKIDEIVATPSLDGDGNLLKNAGAGKMDYGFTKNVADVAALEAMDHMRVIPADIPYTRMIWFNKFARN
ncbi:MAG: peptide ABC transporter substrate-binding protein [Marinovum sp.]|jgi:peptide/nickel transport system substrate-binding protein|nr:peptide ABC transporter substrate-binding protein [Marinovum sp.]MBT4988519.1 peptide ABC transporter substrate-binding protein [Pseudomonadota bacterium]MBT6531603.1 peptide ABC transporter substrate-binding protein [Marinovum sp.]MBT7906436.1 peptide ABC transporter substrate-binding protein [Marinovum sp.]